MIKKLVSALGVAALCYAASAVTRWPVAPVSAQGLPGDADGDGVPDSADCAPADARLSQTHTYYFDEDGDQYGRTADPIQVCAVTAFPGLVPWGNDPDDHNNTLFPIVVPKGDRILGLDFSDGPANGGWRADVARELGADATSLSLQWSGLESAAGVYNGGQVSLLSALKPALLSEGFKLNLTISPFTRTSWALPADLQAAIQNGTKRLSDPDVIARFNATLTFVRDQLGAVPVAGLQIGHEVDLFVSVRSDVQFWGDFATFVGAVRTHAKSLWGNTVAVGITSTHAALVQEPFAGLMQYLNNFTDVVSFTYYPRATTTYDAIDPSQVKAEIQQVIARYYPKPISLQAAAYPSASRTGASTTRQSQFILALFETWDAYTSLMPFVGFGPLYDASPARAGEDASADFRAVPAAQLPTATAWAGSLGLRAYDGDGAAKAAYYTLRTATVNRGWWRVAPQTSRSYRLGFIPALWQHVPETPIQDSVLQYNSAVIAATGDMIAFHFDQGIPWPEAYADTFASPEPPYSANVREVWGKYRASALPGATVAVAITPLGLPRHRMATYWGVGQGFILDDNFNQVPFGPVIDYEGRILPAPWNTYALNSPAVKTAFLNYSRRVIEYFHPTYLITGIEANLAVKDPAAFAQYVELQQYVYTQLRANPAYDDVKIVVSLTAEDYVDDEYGRPALLDALMEPGHREAHLDALRALAPYMDIVGLSLYPFKTLQGTYSIPSWFVDNMIASIRSVTNKPIGITETGYPAVSFNVQSLYFPSDNDKQLRFMRMLFNDLDRNGNVEFVVNWSVRDLTAALDLLRERIAATPGMNQALADFYRYFEFEGIIDAAGNIRPSAALFANLLSLPLENPDHFIPPIAISSPAGTLQAEISVSSAGHLVYSVNRGAARVLDDSPIGVIANGADLGAGVVNITAGPSREVDETYPMRGAHTQAINHYIEIPIDIRRTGSADVTSRVLFRVSDDGVAYRHVLPESGARTITGESSGWAFPNGADFWFQTSTGNYESTYWHGNIGLLEDRIGPPLTVKLPGDGGFAVLTEARLLDYSGMTLKATLGSPVLTAEFLDDASWTVAAGGVSPWRVVMVAPTLTDLVNLDVVQSLNDAPDPALFPRGLDTPWVRGGRAVWSWWSDFASAGNFDTQKRYVDDATRLRAEYVVVDAGWEDGFKTATQDQFSRLSDLVAYAHTQQRFVDIWVWKDWQELGDIATRQAFFRAVHGAGAVGVKIDNIGALNSESFADVTLYEQILREAAQEKLMINFHGLNKATGLSRTYPNEITHEGFMGLETNAFWDRGEFAPPSHNATVPFVRMAVGVGDYTPVTFDPRKIGATTFAHQLATAGLFTSPVQHFADDPTLLLAQPLVQDVFRLLPTEWDETRILPPSAVGELAIMARRKRNRWFLFAVNGDAAQSKTVGVPLTFLGGGRYDAILITDSTQTSFGREDRVVTAAESVTMPLLPGGGYVAILSPAAEPTRHVLQGFSSIPPSFTNAGWERSYTALATRADMVSHTQQDAVPWVQALTSSDYHTYSNYLQAFWNLFSAADAAVIPGKPKYLMLNPINPATYTGLAPQWGEEIAFTLPSPWNTYSFDHPNVKQAFLNYVIAAVDTLHPTHLALNVEANVLLARAPGQWAAFKDFNAYIYTQVKQRYPNLVVFSTIQYEHMLGLTEESRTLALMLRDGYSDVLASEVRSLLQHSDLVAISSYPFLIENNRYVRPDGSLDQDYYERAFALAASLGKPLAFEQTGYISRDLFVATRNVTVPGSPERQQKFVEHVLHDAHVEDVQFVINFMSSDYGTAYGTAPSTMTWAYTGLWNEDGTPKPALATWDSYRVESTGSTGAGPADTGGPTSPYQAMALAMQLAATTGSLAAPWSSEGPPEPELFVRWQQFASMLPAFQPPPANDPTAPWSFADPYRAAAAATLARRELFLPYLQPLFDAYQSTGQFALYRLSLDGQPPLLMLGDWVLVAPVVEAGATTREIALPAGSSWIDWYTGQLRTGGQTIVIDAPLDRIPLFIKVITP